MMKGIIFALSACLIWGLIFAIPEFMKGFSPLEITIARYFLYGSVSGLIFFFSRKKGRCIYPKSVWFKAASLSILSTIAYYSFLILGLRYSSPAICALILGLSPITIAFYGNWKEKETSFKNLLIPSSLILIGLAIINVPHFSRKEDIFMHIVGLLSSFLALSSWSLYVVFNSRYLKKHPEIRSSDWSTLTGVSAFFWAAVLLVLVVLFFPEEVTFSKYTFWSKELAYFLAGIGILGTLCSWIGGFFWNQASVYLPVPLAGQMMIFETIFGVLFFYLIRKEIPPFIESIGVLFLLLEEAYGIYQFSRKASSTVS